MCNVGYQRKDDDSNARCSRGLKVLSVKVRDIVFQKRQTSYKEVAEALINDASLETAFPGGTVAICYYEEQKEESQGRAKRQEKSIRCS
jgi:hypothetical protein